MEEKQKLFTKKKVAVGVFMLLALATAVYAVPILFHTVDVDATISEALISSTLTVDVSGFPGETVEQYIVVENLANVDLTATLTWTEDTNANSVTYTHDLPKTVTVNPGLNNISVEFVYDTDTPIGDFNGTITLDRS